MLLQKYGKLDCHERRIWRCLYAICFRLAWARKRRLSVTASAAWRRLVGSKSCTLDLNILRENSLPGPDMLAERSLKSRRPLSARSRETGRKGGGAKKRKKENGRTKSEYNERGATSFARLPDGKYARMPPRTQRSGSSGSSSCNSSSGTEQVAQ